MEALSALAYAGLLVLSVEMSTSGVSRAGSTSELSNQNSQRRGPAFQ